MNDKLDSVFINKIQEINKKFEKFESNKAYVAAIAGFISESNNSVILHKKLFEYSKANMPGMFAIFSNLKPFMKSVQELLKKFPIDNLYVYELNAKNEYIQKLNSDLQNLNTEYFKISTELSRFKGATGLSPTELETVRTLQMKCEALEKDKKHLVMEYAKVMQDCKNLTQENTILQKTCDTLTEENNNLLKIIEALEREHEKLKKQCVDLQQKCFELENRVKFIPLQTQHDLDDFYKKITGDILNRVMSNQRGEKFPKINTINASINNSDLPSDNPIRL